MIEKLWKREPHYLRLVQGGSDKHRPKKCAVNPEDCGVSSARWIEYQEERIFEILPEALAEIHLRDPNGSVVVEADADPAMRCAYPYDHRVFVMPVPTSIDQVFRDPTSAAEELQRVLDDTAEFASEIFGLFSAGGPDDGEPSEERVDLTATAARGFLYSPLGDELATRIQLQQPYHGLVESDVIVVNTSVGETGSETDECLGRVARLLERARGASGRPEELFLCDPRDWRCKVCKKLLKALEPMCRDSH